MTITEEQARMIGKAIREEAKLVALPIENPIERRAVCLKLAIETRSSAFPATSTATDDAADVLTAARMYDAFLTGTEPAAEHHARLAAQNDPLPPGEWQACPRCGDPLTTGCRPAEGICVVDPGDLLAAGTEQ